MTEIYQNAFKEVSELLKYISPDLINKIPNSFLNFIEEKKSKTYEANFDINLPLKEQSILKETRVILSLIYRNYFCDKDKNLKFKIEDAIEIKKERIRLNKKYNQKKLFNE